MECEKLVELTSGDRTGDGMQESQVMECEKLVEF